MRSGRAKIERPQTADLGFVGRGTAGGVAFLLDEVMPASPAYRWTVNHTVRLEDPPELFPTFITEAGV